MTTNGGTGGTWSNSTPATFTGAQVSSIPVEVSANTTAWTTEPYSSATGVMTNTLYPQPNGFAIAAGDCKGEANYSDLLGTYTASGVNGAFTGVPGSTPTATVPLGMLPLDVTTSTGTPVSGATVTMTAASTTAGTACAADSYTLPSTGPDGLSRTAVPYGLYNVTIKGTIASVATTTTLEVMVGASTVVTSISGSVILPPPARPRAGGALTMNMTRIREVAQRARRRHDDEGMTLVELLLASTLLVVLTTLVMLSMTTFTQLGGSVDAQYQEYDTILPAAANLRPLVAAEAEPGPADATGAPIPGFGVDTSGTPDTVSGIGNFSLTFYANIANANGPAKIVAGLTTISGTPDTGSTTTCAVKTPCDFQVQEYLPNAGTCPGVSTGTKCTYPTTYKLLTDVLNVINTTAQPVFNYVVFDPATTCATQTVPACNTFVLTRGQRDQHELSGPVGNLRHLHREPRPVQAGEWIGHLGRHLPGRRHPASRDRPPGESPRSMCPVTTRRTPAWSTGPRATRRPRTFHTSIHRVLGRSPCHPLPVSNPTGLGHAARSAHLGRTNPPARSGGAGAPGDGSTSPWTRPVRPR